MTRAEQLEFAEVPFGEAVLPSLSASQQKPDGTSAKERALAKQRDYNQRPENAARRHAYYFHRYHNEPGYKERILQRSKSNYENNKVRKYKQSRTWIKNNRAKYKKWFAEHMREKRRSQPWWNIRNRLASRLWHAIAASKGKKAAKTQTLIGCTVAELRAYLESKFRDGMTWEAFLRGEIHIDHIVPCASFDLSKPEEQKRCFHWSNLQPLWTQENLKKGSLSTDGVRVRLG